MRTQSVKAPQALFTMNSDLVQAEVRQSWQRQC